MGIALSSIGAKFGYCVESTAGTRPTTGFTYLPDIKSSPDFNTSPSGIESTTFDNLRTTTKIAGLADVEDAYEYGCNMTNELITAWNACVSAYTTAKAAGKAMWFVTEINGLDWVEMFEGEPVPIHYGALETNSLAESSLHIVPSGEPSLYEKSSS